VFIRGPASQQKIVRSRGDARYFKYRPMHWDRGRNNFPDSKVIEKLDATAMFCREAALG
jgi:hypothetical protein